MATWLSITNRLQKRLRDTQTATVETSTYSTLVGELVNQAKRDVEAAWDWSMLRTVLSFTTSAGTATYAITGSNERSRVISPQKEIYDDTNDAVIRPAPDWFIDRVTFIGTTQNAPPVYYRFRGVSGGELQITLYPTPNGTATIRVPMVVPQADLDADATVLTVSEEPVYQRALYLAIDERGEDGSTNARTAEDRANGVLFDAVLIDMGRNAGESTASLE